MITRLRAFMADPFDPQNNIALFSAFDRMLPQSADLKTTSDPDAAWLGICAIRTHIERTYGPGWKWPEEHAFKSAWPSLTPRARWLVTMHDALHVVLDVEQDAAGEYELAVRIIAARPALFRRHAVPPAAERALRAYGALALCTVPIGMTRAGLAPLRGVLAGLRGVRA